MNRDCKDGQPILFIIKKNKKLGTPWPSTFFDGTMSQIPENEHLFPPRSFFRVRKGLEEKNGINQIELTYVGMPLSDLDSSVDDMSDER